VKLLLDTHVWVWAHLEPEKLAPKVAAALLSPKSELWLSPISVWELLLLVEKRRITLAGTAEAWIETALSRVPMQDAALTRDVAIRSRTVRVPTEDPADRFLAASAAAYDLTLVTSDATLLRGKGYRTMSNR